MNRPATHQRLLAGSALLAMLALVSCQDPGPAAPVLPPPAAPAAHPHTANTSQPTSPIKLEKPRLVGPVAPAIVILPEKYPQPMIRVRIGAVLDAPPVVRKAAYRGKVETCKLPDGHYIALNTLPLDSYLQGVLAKELYNSWDIDAFRAQAIAARTYALFMILTDGRNRQWDVTDDEGSQMYGGITGETAKSRQAVADTSGEVLIAHYGEKNGIFCAFYSACHGAATQDPNEAWGDFAVAPLSARKVGNIDANCPKFNWPTMSLDKADLTRCVNNWGVRNDFPQLAGLAEIRSATTSKRNAATGRPTEITLTDIHGKSAVIRAEEFRLALVYDPDGAAPKPFSSWFDIKDAGGKLLLTNGRGYGHGIGLSQWGAQAMALNGRDYQQILSFYYPTSTLRALW